MKIVDMRGTACRFDEVDVGEYFYADDAEDAGLLRRKIAIGADREGNPINTLIVSSGLTGCTTAKAMVQPVEVEITVLANVAGRT